LPIARKGYFIAFAAALSVWALSASQALSGTPGLDRARLSVLTPPGPAEPPPEAFQKIPRLIHARHKVAKGENIRTIASSYGTDVRSLQSTNNNEFIFLPKGNYMRVHNGRGFLYEVGVDGETLAGIARRFKAKDADLKEFEAAIVKGNDLPPSSLLAPYKFKKGDRLQLPGVVISLDAYHMPFSSWSRISSSYGMRYHPILKRRIFHKGCDIPMPVGTPVYPSRSGTVAFSGWKDGYGHTVEVKHTDRSLTRYGHLSGTLVRVGEEVQKSKTMLGRVGSSGMSTGPHLHFEIITSGGKSINPMNKIGRR